MNSSNDIDDNNDTLPQTEDNNNGSLPQTDNDGSLPQTEDDSDGSLPQIQDDSDSSLPQTIEDEPNAHFEPIQGKYGPYFSNFTEQMLFFWTMKHMIGNLSSTFKQTFVNHFIIILYQGMQAYQYLMVIIKHPDFNPEDAIENLRWFKTWRKRLSLQTIKIY